MSRVAASQEAENQIRFSRNQLLPQVDVNFAFTRRETAPSFRQSFGLDGYKFATFFTIAMPVDRTQQQVEYQSALIDRERRRRDADTLERLRLGDRNQYYYFASLYPSFGMNSAFVGGDEARFPSDPQLPNGADNPFAGCRPDASSQDLVLDCGDKEGVFVAPAPADRALVSKTRERFPFLKDRRPAVH